MNIQLNTTYSSKYQHKRNTRKWAKEFLELHAKVHPVLEEADVDGHLNDFVFV
jgi:hypothetical protein